MRLKQNIFLHELTQMSNEKLEILSYFFEFFALKDGLTYLESLVQSIRHSSSCDFNWKYPIHHYVKSRNWLFLGLHCQFTFFFELDEVSAMTGVPIDLRKDKYFLMSFNWNIKQFLISDKLKCSTNPLIFFLLNKQTYAFA